jgi:1-acyl-sn-glycerol-3-phosphate acyltransferase
VWAFVTLAILIAAVVCRWKHSGRSLGSVIGLGIVRIYAKLWHGCSFPAPAEIPASGPALLVVNHTSSPDGCFVQCGCRRGLTFLVAKEFFHPKILWIWATTGCVPVDRQGCDLRAVRLGLRRLKEGRVVVVFPEGSLSLAGRKGMRTPKCGAAYMALRSKVPVYTAFISGGPQTPSVKRGWLCPSSRRVRIVYGKALDLTPYLDRPITRPLLEEVSRFIMSQVSALAPRINVRSQDNATDPSPGRAGPR